MEIKYYFRNAKSLSGIYRMLVADLTKGNAFRYNSAEIIQKKAEAELYAMQIIKDQIDQVPKRIKRDLTLS